MKIDSHAHVFLKALPQAPGARYEPAADAPLSAYLQQLHRNGLSHGVLVQPSFLGTDNTFLFNSLAQAGGQLRGVVVVDPAIAEGDLAQMHRIGVVGIRLNLIGQANPDVQQKTWGLLWDFVRAHDWHVEVHAHAKDLPAVVGPLVSFGLRVVVDHFGRPDPQQGTADPGFRYLLGLAATGRVWVKVSAGYRLGGAGSRLPYEAAAEVLSAFGVGRLVWGSDWPHTTFDTLVRYEDTFRAFEAWIPDEDSRNAMLGATAAELFKIL